MHCRYLEPFIGTTWEASGMTTNMPTRAARYQRGPVMGPPALACAGGGRVCVEGVLPSEGEASSWTLSASTVSGDRDNEAFADWIATQVEIDYP